MKLEMVGISIYGSLRGVARFPVSYVKGFYQPDRLTGGAQVPLKTPFRTPPTN